MTICHAPNPWGMSWDEHRNHLGEGTGGILRVSPNGGNPEVLVAVKNGEVAAHPQMMPGAQAVMFTLTTANGIGARRRLSCKPKIRRAQNSDSRRQRGPVSAHRASGLFL